MRPRGDRQREGAFASEEARRAAGACAERPKGWGSSAGTAARAPWREPGERKEREGAERREEARRAGGGRGAERGRVYRPGDFG